MKKYFLTAIVATGVGFWLGRPGADDKDSAESQKSTRQAESEVCADLIARYNKLSEQYVAMQKDHQDSLQAAVPVAVATPKASCPESSATPIAKDEIEPKETASGPNSDSGEMKGDDFQAGNRSDAPSETDRVVQVTGDQLTKEFARFDADAQKSNSGSKRRSFLNRIVLADPHGTIDRMKEVSEKDKWLQKMMGVWRGGLVYTKKNREPGYIRLEIRNPETPPWQWAVKVDLHEKKGVVDRKTGGTDLLHTVSDASQAYFVRSSESSYLQFYFLPAANSMLGNYYERGKDGSYTRTGTYTLKRVED